MLSDIGVWGGNSKFTQGKDLSEQFSLSRLKILTSAAYSLKQRTEDDPCARH
jgi:hypothetical protein